MTVYTDSNSVYLKLSSLGSEIYTPGARSDTKMGVYKGNQNKWLIDEFDDYIGPGKQLTIATEFLASDVWAAVEGPDWTLDPWIGFYRLNLGVPMFPDTEAPTNSDAEVVAALAAVAAGTHDAHFTTLATNLKNKGQADCIIRLGWEFNGNFTRHRASPSIANWVAAWQRIVTTMRAVAGTNFKFIWNTTRGITDLASEAILESAYPGNTYVDIIGMDVYDTQWDTPLSPADRWDKIYNDPGGIKWMINFALAKGKPIAFPEWGIVRQTGAPRYGGGDSPEFINYMAGVIKNNDTYYHAYWDYDAPDINSTISDGGAPKAISAFVLQFTGIAPPQTVIVAGPYPPSQPWTVLHYNHNDEALGDCYPDPPEFALYLNKVGYLNYDLDASHPLAVKEKTEPYATDFKLFRGKNPVMGGIHTNISIGDIETRVFQISGKDWLHYLDLRFWPFDPTNPVNSAYLAASKDMFNVVKEILDGTLALSNSLSLDYNFGLSGTLINYKIEIADTETLLNKFTSLGQQSPGFDMEITHDRVMKLYAPKKGVLRSLTLEQGSNIFELQYANNGPKGTHTLGLAQSASSRIGVSLDHVNLPKYRRLDTSEEFSQVQDATMLGTLTSGASERNATPHTEFTCKVVPDFLEDFFGAVSIGDTIPVLGNIGWDLIDGNYRIVSIIGRPNDERDEEYELGFDDGTISL